MAFIRILPKIAKYIFANIEPNLFVLCFVSLELTTLYICFCPAECRHCYYPFQLYKRCHILDKWAHYYLQYIDSRETREKRIISKRKSPSCIVFIGACVSVTLAIKPNNQKQNRNKNENTIHEPWIKWSHWKWVQ